MWICPQTLQTQERTHPIYLRPPCPCLFSHLNLLLPLHCSSLLITSISKPSKLDPGTPLTCSPLSLPSSDQSPSTVNFTTKCFLNYTFSVFFFLTFYTEFLFRFMYMFTIFNLLFLSKYYLKITFFILEFYIYMTGSLCCTADIDTTL